jgi:hypothetical protein
VTVVGALPCVGAVYRPVVSIKPVFAGEIAQFTAVLDSPVIIQEN